MIGLYQTNLKSIRKSPDNTKNKVSSSRLSFCLLFANMRKEIKSALSEISLSIFNVSHVLCLMFHFNYLKFQFQLAKEITLDYSANGSQEFELN